MGRWEGKVAHPGQTTLVEIVEPVTGWCRSNRVWIDTVGTIARAAAELRGSVAGPDGSGPASCGHLGPRRH